MSDMTDMMKAEIERLRAALEQIDHGWETPMEDKAWRAVAHFMWETARTALAQGTDALRGGADV